MWWLAQGCLLLRPAAEIIGKGWHVDTFSSVPTSAGLLVCRTRMTGTSSLSQSCWISRPKSALASTPEWLSIIPKPLATVVLTARLVAGPVRLAPSPRQAEGGLPPGGPSLQQPRGQPAAAGPARSRQEHRPGHPAGGHGLTTGGGLPLHAFAAGYALCGTDQAHSGSCAAARAADRVTLGCVWPGCALFSLTQPLGPASFRMTA